jgi:hydrogenase maturation protease
LVAGIGNIFLGDDGFGVEVARRLSSRQLGDGVSVGDFGIRGLDLAYALLEGFDQVILVDAVARGGLPGTLYLLDPDVTPSVEGPSMLEGHAMTPTTVIDLVKRMGGSVGTLRVVGCEPATIASDEDIQVGLSDPVMAAVDQAVTLVEELLEGKHA